MKNIPVFDTSAGVASLTLTEIPYKGEAYVKIQASRSAEEFTGECIEFCRACGAEKIFASGHPWLEKFPLHTAVWKMKCCREGIPDTDAALFPVQEKTLKLWTEIYNEKMKAVPNSTWMRPELARQMLEAGDGYFIHRGDTLLGIGRAGGSTIHALAAVQPGAGREVLAALNHALSGEDAELEVASANEKAVRLYEKLGFTAVQEISRWYQVF